MKNINAVIILLLVVCVSIIIIGYTENQKLKEQLKQTQNDLYSVRDDLSKSQKEFYLTKNELTLTTENLSVAKKTIQKDESDWEIILNHTSSLSDNYEVIESYNEMYNKITVWDYTHKKEYQSLYDKNLELTKLHESALSYVTNHRDVLELRLGKTYVKNTIKVLQDSIISDQKSGDILKQWISASSTKYYT